MKEYFLFCVLFWFVSRKPTQHACVMLTDVTNDVPVTMRNMRTSKLKVHAQSRLRDTKIRNLITSAVVEAVSLDFNPEFGCHCRLHPG